MSYDYDAAAKTAYKNMVACFSDSKCSDYWKLGNAFDSMTDYLRFWGGTDTTLPKTIYDRYTTLINPGPDDPKRSDCWYDDYGWWGIASAKAFDPAYDFFFTGDYKAKFQAVAKFCWKTFNEGKPWSTAGWSYQGAPNVWTNRDNGKPETHYWDLKANWATPRFDNGVGSGLHGVWQYEIFRVKRDISALWETGMITKAESEPSLAVSCMHTHSQTVRSKHRSTKTQTIFKACCWLR